MKLSEIVASLAELKQTLASFVGDKAKATTEAVSGFSASLATLETGAVTALNQANTDLATAKTTIGTATATADKAVSDLSTTGAALQAACKALSLEVKEGSTHAEMISAMQGAVTATLSKLQVDASKVPGGVPTKAGESKPAGKLSLDEQVAASKSGATPTK